MKKTITFLFLFAGIAMQSFSQKFDWVNTGGYAGVANSYLGAVDIAKDGQGNLYVLDYANGAQKCQGDTAYPWGTGYNIFIYKFNSQGQLLFINPIGTSLYPLNLEVDDDDNLYMLAHNTSSSIIVNGDTAAAVAQRNYLLKFDTSGNLLWNHNTGFGNTWSCMLQYHHGYLYYQSGNLSVGKIDTTGQFINQLTAGFYSSPTSYTSIFFKNSGVFSNGDLLFAATSWGTIAYGNDTLYPTGNPALTIPLLFIRCDTAMNLVWARYFSNVRTPDENVIPLCIGNDDAVYAGVQVNYDLQVGSETIFNTTGLTSTGGIIKVDANGNGVWARELVGSFPLLPWCMTNVPDGSGVFCGGEFFGNAQLGGNTINSQNGTAFITKIDYNGNFQNAFTFAKGNNGSKAKSMIAGNNGIYYVGGKLNNSIAPEFSCVPREANLGFYLGKFSEQLDPSPQVDFSFIREQNQTFFNSRITQGEFVSINFGDGTSTTTQQNPTHIYTPGFYNAILTSRNDCFERKDTISLLFKGIQSVTPNRTANIGYYIANIKGGFPFSNAIVQLKKNNTVLTADTVIVHDFGNISAHYLFGGVDTGYYDLIVTSGAFTDTLKNGVKLEQPDNKLPEIQVVGVNRKLRNFYAQERVIVTNNSNASLLAVPVYVSIEGITPSDIVMNNVINYIDSSSAVYRDSLQTEFFLLVDSISGDTTYFGIFMLPIIESGQSKTISFYTKYPELGTQVTKAYAGLPLFSEADLVTLGLRTNCNFLPVCVQCAMDIAGLFPVVGCAVGGANIGCELGSIFRKSTSIPTTPGKPTPSGNKPEEVVVNLGLVTAGGLLSCGGAEAFEVTAKATASGFKSAVAGAIPALNEANDLIGAFGSCVGFSKLGSGPQCNPRNLSDWTTFIVAGLDPNIKVGSSDGSPQNYINNRDLMHYQIMFENIGTATAPAREVLIRDTLDLTKLDISTFQFTGYSFGTVAQNFFESDTAFVRQYDLRPTKNAFLRISGKVNKTAGVVEWQFSTYDTANLALVNVVDDGFLNPNVSKPEGEGSVYYTIRPKVALPHETFIENKAYIYFDAEQPVVTPVWLNVIDDEKPQSNVLTLPPVINDTLFTVRWQGNDAHSGIRSYDLYVTINDTADFVFSNATQDSANFKGSFGDTYKFFTVATDRVGNVEDLSTTPDAVVTLQQPVVISVEEMAHENFGKLVNIYPNPSEHVLNVEVVSTTAKDPVSKLEVFDMQGRIVIATTFESKTALDISQLVATIYQIKISNGKSVAVKRFVKL